MKTIDLVKCYCYVTFLIFFPSYKYRYDPMFSIYVNLFTLITMFRVKNISSGSDVESMLMKSELIQGVFLFFLFMIKGKR